MVGAGGHQSGGGKEIGGGSESRRGHGGGMTGDKK